VCLVYEERMRDGEAVREIFYSLKVMDTRL
jgi:hypothetical protein